MRLTLITTSLLLALSAHAAPMPQQAPDEQTAQQTAQPQPIDKAQSSQIQQMGQAVAYRASDLVITTLGFLGVPYRRGGNTVETGFDCSGFVRAMYDQTVGHLLPRRAAEQAAATQKIDRSELKPGDLVFFNTMRRAFSHVGIYIGEGRFIHSPRSGAQVRVEDMSASYWQRRFNGARRVVLAQDGGAATESH
jgi:cell wall-associated NlpC family hydrolase